MHDPNTSDWTEELEPKLSDISILGWCLVAIRAVLMLSIILVGIVFLFIAWDGTPLCWAPPSNQWTGGELGLSHWRRAIGLRMSVRGTPMSHPGAVVANHSSWLDIIVLNAAKRVFFVSKAEVSSWPGIGFLANITGTVFIRRERRDSKLQKNLFQTRLGLGHKLLFFPEGTSTDSLRVLPFKSTLFAAFLNLS